MRIDVGLRDYSATARVLRRRSFQCFRVYDSTVLSQLVGVTDFRPGGAPYTDNPYGRFPILSVKRAASDDHLIAVF